VPIYEQKYESWDGVLKPQPRSWWIIAKTQIELLWKKGMIMLILVASIAFLVRSIQIYGIARFSDKLRAIDLLKGFKVDPAFFYDFINNQWFFFVVIVMLAGAALIVSDRRHRAFSIYFAKPVGFWDYTLGKLVVVAFYSSLITLVPGVLLFLLQVAVATDTAFLSRYFWIVLSETAYTAMMFLVLGSLILALSSLARSSGAAAILFFSLIYFPEVAVKILARVPNIGIISVQADLRQVGAVLFGLARPYSFSPLLAGGFLILCLLFCWLILFLKIRPTEVVK